MLSVIRIEPVGIHRVADPNPPQRYENQDKFPELQWVKMTLMRVAQDMRYISDRHRKIRSKNASSQVAWRLDSKYFMLGIRLIVVFAPGGTSGCRDSYAVPGDVLRRAAQDLSTC